MSTINQETGEVICGRSPRFTMWVALFVFSTITLGSSVQVRNQQSHPTSFAEWAVACTAVTFTMTAIIVAAHIHALCSFFVGTKVEGAVIALLVAAWTVTVALVTDASNNLAVLVADANNSNIVASSSLNGNLYYFSWAGFVTSILLLVSFLRQAFGVDLVDRVQNRATRLTLWSGMLACAMVEMGASARMFHNSNCKASSSSVFCMRTKYAIAIGAIGLFLSLVVVGMKILRSTAPFVVEAVMATILAVLNGFGVAFITGPKGPGSTIGNVYYFAWLSCLCAAMLMADCFNQRTEGSATATASKPPIEDNLHDEDVSDMEDVA
jgi:hypothetical protein